MSPHRSLLQRLIDYIQGEQYTNPDVTITYNDEPEEEQEQLAEPISEPEYENLDTVGQLRPGDIHLHGNFRMVNSRFVRSGLRITEAVFSDQTGSARVVWFNANVAPLIRSNIIYELRGKYELKRSRFQVSNAQFRPLNEGCKPFIDAKKRTGKSKEVTPPPPKNRSNKWEDLTFEGKGLSSDSKWRALRQRVFERDSYTCQVCGLKNEHLQVDHIVELSLGGTNAIGNLQTLCVFCHEDKHLKKLYGRTFDAVNNYGENYEPSKKVKALIEAKKKNTGLEINYTDREGVKTRRVIHPRKLEWGYPYMGKKVHRDQVYVYAYCDLDKADRTFRVSRMKLVNKH